MLALLVLTVTGAAVLFAREVGLWLGLPRYRVLWVDGGSARGAYTRRGADWLAAVSRWNNPDSEFRVVRRGERVDDVAGSREARGDLTRVRRRAGSRP